MRLRQILSQRIMVFKNFNKFCARGLNELYDNKEEATNSDGVEQHNLVEP